MPSLQTLFRSVRGPRARGAALVVAALLVLSGWLMAAPPGASPDDGYHLASIWCAEGFKDGLCLEDPGAADRSRVLIPLSTTDVTCFQHDGRKSAACALGSLTPAEPGQYSVVRGSNIGGERPNTYYRAMHRLIGDDVFLSTARMRVANLLIVLLMVGATAAVAVPAVRRAVLLSFALTSVPLGLFLMTSLNTSAWGLAGLATLWANGLTMLTHHRLGRRIAAGGLAAIGLVLGLGSRTEATIHVLITAAVVLVLWLGSRAPVPTAARRAAGRWTMTARTSALVLVSSLAAAGALVALAPRSAGLDGVLAGIRQGHDRLANRGIGDPFLAIAFEVPSLWTGALGHIWGLGALDTPIPMLATIPIAGLFVALLALGLQQSSRPRLLAATVVGVALFAFPMFALMQAGLLVYEQLQPRQFMVLLYVLLGVAAVPLSGERGLTLARGMRTVTIAGLGMAHSVALLVAMRRHITGLVEFRYVSFSSDIEWWWSFGPGPNTVWAITSLAYIVLITLIVGMFPRPDGMPTDIERSERDPQKAARA